IVAFGLDFHLNLTADSGFIAPLYTVTQLGVPLSNNQTDLHPEEEDTDFKHCFYTGHVNAQPEHTAVISLCSGLFGTFRSPEGEFFVEPLQNHKGKDYEEEHNKPHVVYRKDTPNKNATCDTSGLAELGTVCDPYRSCSISEDNGLSTAFTVAHELGHVTGYGECLLDEPTSKAYTLPQQLPGRIYSVNKQCEFIFGPGTQVCPYMGGTQMSYYLGKGGDELNAIDQKLHNAGDFGAQAQKELRRVAVLSTCLGLMELNVHLGRPKNGGKYCLGRRMKFRSCSSDPCSKLKKDFREEQCEAFDGKHFNINGLPPNVRWVPKYSGPFSNSRGEFLLNGEFVVSMFKREVKIGNTVIEYSGSDHEIERINCTDRIDEEITVQVLSVGNLYNPDVRYSFNIPIEDKPQKFFWNPYGPWQECSKRCQGERKRRPLCSRESDRVVVSDQRCLGSLRPPLVTEPCNTECEIRWHIARKSECTAQCGPGYRTREIYCAKHSRSEEKTEKIDDRYCSNQRKPDETEACQGECNVGGWRYASWTECSKSCGGGAQRRGAVCVGSLGSVLDDSKCSQQNKLVTQKCNEFVCPQWKTGDWSECLVTCGKGYKHRQTWCQFGEDRLDDRLCDSSSKPVSMQTCQQQECAAWQVGPWGQCTTTCGPGYQMRAVKCVVRSYGSVMDDTECNAATRPTDTQCTATCGKGTRMRYVSCRDNQGGVAEESDCSHLPKPPARQACSVSSCGQWKTLEWTLCSVSCGQGKTTRQVVCVNFSDQVVDVSECDPDDRPASEQECAMSQCPPRSDQGRLPTHRPPGRAYPPGAHQWRIGPWGACSSTCAGGFQRRAVVCQDENGYAACYCDDRTKPVEQRSCESGPCSQWVYGNWGECTKSCGGGVKTRLVVCQRPNGERFSDLNCEILDKPPDREQCTSQACPPDAGWNTGPWSSVRP
ncbi:UNVERIFIED_CONTAM: hypothetical protein FKN15_036208, partial [Acipenser sinensis]